MASQYRYQAEVSHAGLNKYRIIKATTQHELNKKVYAVKSQWDEQWQAKLEKEKRIKNNDEMLRYALELTQEEERIQKALDTILVDSLHPEKLNFETLKNHSKFQQKHPQKPEHEACIPEPKLTNEKYNPKPSFFTKLSKTKMEAFKANNLALFQFDHAQWESNVKTQNENFAKKLCIYKAELDQWKQEEKLFYAALEEENARIDSFERDFYAGIPTAVERYFTLVLEKNKFPFKFNRSVSVELNSENKILLVDMLLPTLEDLPKLKSVSFVKSRNELKETCFSESYLRKKYETVIYQIVLQTINYVFSLSPRPESIDAVVFNGKINTIDRATGKSIEPYILSVKLDRNAFNSINLKAIDPKAWFKSAKGVSAASLATVTPVAPVVAMNRQDSRFIDGYSIVESLDYGTNLAAMDWQDFENLIREIFEQEFCSTGGEVKITQASRDGGVDAVVFDPDPIRGGKIVIQAKRYTNVVGVSAVRDLYGTVMNEGAIKGILVTTSNYGNDAYSFANGKPLTLLNGANLLSLMEKHGHRAYINIKEAKLMLNN